MTDEEIKKCFEYLKSLGLLTTLSQSFSGDKDCRFYSEDTDHIQWIVRYEYLYKRFKVVTFVAVEETYPHRIITYAAKGAETPYQLEVRVKSALALLDEARKKRIELFKERKTKEIKSVAAEWSA